MRLYLAGALFTQAERRWLRALARGLRAVGHEVFLPQDEAPTSGDPAAIYATNRAGLEAADAVVAVLDGADADSGTCWECGFATARGKPVVAIRTDFRPAGDDDGWNLMLRRSATATVEHTGEDIEPVIEAVARALGKLGS